MTEPQLDPAQKFHPSRHPSEAIRMAYQDGWAYEAIDIDTERAHTLAPVFLHAFQQGRHEAKLRPLCLTGEPRAASIRRDMRVNGVAS